MTGLFPDSIKDLFHSFLNEKAYLKGVTQKTIDHYKDCFIAFQKYHGEFTEQGVKTFVMNLVKAGIKPGAINSYARGM